MELTAIAQWLNTAFAGYDYAILQALHNLAGAAGGFFTPLCRHASPLEFRHLDEPHDLLQR